VTNPRGVFSVSDGGAHHGLLIPMARIFPDSVRFQDKSTWGQQRLWDMPQKLTET